MDSRLKKAIVSSMLGRSITYLVQFAFLAFYARLFGPEEFGVIASLQVFVIFFQLFTDVGIGPALINKRVITTAQRDGIFSFTLLVGGIIGLLFYALSFQLNSFYGRDDYPSFAIFIAVGVFFQAACIVPMVSQQMETQFTRMAKVDVFSEVVSAIVVVSLYTMDYGIIALATRPMINGFSRFICFYWLMNKTQLQRSKLSHQLFHIKEIARFSLYQFSFNFINYFSRNLDTILVGKYIGIAQLGVYDKSYQLMKYPMQLISMAMSPAIQPVLKSHSDDKTYILTQHNILAKMLLIIAIPVALFMFVNASNIVLLLFGSNWLAVTPLIKILSISIPVQMMLSTAGAFYQVLNKPNVLFYSGLISAILNVVFIIAGIMFGSIKMVALCITISFILNFLISYCMLFKFGFGSGLAAYFQLIIPVIARFIPTVVAYIELMHFMPANNQNLSSVFLTLIGSGILLIVLLAIFNFKFMKEQMLLALRS